MLKLNKLFYAVNESETFCAQIDPLQSQRDFLGECKNAIRDHLRPRIKAASTEILGMERAVEPRFRTQGSWSYKTCVRPAFLPPQEIDWDYGVYLPIHVWENNGPPHIMAKLYFDLVEGLLKDLCKEKNWKLLSGKERKQTCIRVQVADWAHIDIPLYAAPEEKFHQIREKAALSGLMRKGEAYDSSYSLESAEFIELTGQVWEDLDDIVMATRSGEWKASDPEAVSKWFNDRVKEYGHDEQLRRISRYLKAWRDYHWRDGGGPTSVSLMIAIAQNFTPQHGRDDLVLEASAEHLANVIQGELRERGIDEGAEDFNNRLSESEKKLTAQRARELATTIRKARSYGGHMKQQAIMDIQKCFGDRIPNKEDWVGVDNGADAVRTTPAQPVAKPIVRATHAG